MDKHNVALNGLRVFEAAARHLNFTAAAQELNITQAAVSQQIRTLEKQIGTPLFTRLSRRLALTHHGQELINSIRPALESINRALDRATGTDQGNVLTVTTLPSFASRWLIPRLDGFQQSNNEFELHIHTSGSKTNLIDGNIDAAIRLGAFDEEGLIREFLIPDSLCLVGTPELAEKLGDNLDNLVLYPMSMDGTRFSVPDMKDITGHETEQYLHSLPLDKSRLKVTVFSASDNVVLSALSGQSTALTRLSLCVDDLDAGRLQILFNLVSPLSEGTSLVYPEFRSKDSRILKFKAWITAEADQFNSRMESYQLK